MRASPCTYRWSPLVSDGEITDGVWHSTDGSREDFLCINKAMWSKVTLTFDLLFDSAEK